MNMSLNVELLESSFALVAPQADELVDDFYNRLFTQYPQIRSMFHSPMEQQKQYLIAVLAMVVTNLRNPEVLTKNLGELGLRHAAQYGVSREQYPIVGQILLESLAHVAGDAWNDELQQAWTDAYAAIQSIIYAVLDSYEAEKTDAA
jgi:hemoglobin-like flavoprotein